MEPLAAQSGAVCSPHRIHSPDSVALHPGYGAKKSSVDRVTKRERLSEEERAESKSQ